jgi:choline dehydrogenase-like flavoprotein
MKIAVIGSSHAAISAVEGLIERGIRPVIFDVGEILPADIQERADTLASASPDAWNHSAIQFSTPPSISKLPRKTVFGSDYIYAANRSFAPVSLDGTTAVPSFAKGGFSMGWGGALLPPHPGDIKAWPFRFDELEKYFSAALKSMPLSAEKDGLEEQFPLHHAVVGPMQLTSQGQHFLRDLERAKPLLNKKGDRTLFGAARLAVDMESCTHCGMCLTGCPYGLIYSLDKVLDKFVATGEAEYQKSAYVYSVKEKGNKVEIKWLSTINNKRHTDIFDRVFIGAGALSSARIVLNSLKAYDHTLNVIDSAKFALPMLRFQSSPLEWPNSNTLADIFIEAIYPEVSDRWLHIQVSPLSDPMLQGLHIQALNREREFSTIGNLLQPLTSRLMVAWCAMHSDLSSKCKLSVSIGTDDMPVLNISAGLSTSRPHMRAYSRKLRKLGFNFRTFFPPMAELLSPACSTGHCGGSFPMREQPSKPFETDVLGRLKDQDRIHLIDASTFPSIPATTIALLIRANARRIVAETPFDQKAN